MINCSVCGGHLDQNTEFCAECGAPAEEAIETDAAQGPCPICGKENHHRDTFRCPGCQDNLLCLSHRVKNSKFDPDSGGFVSEYYCTRCWKQLGFTMISE